MQAHCLHGAGCYFGGSSLQKSPGQHKGAQESLGNISRGAVLNGHPLCLCMLAGGAEVDQSPCSKGSSPGQLLGHSMGTLARRCQ